MKQMTVHQIDRNTIIYAIDDMVVTESKSLLNPAQFVRLCKESDSKITIEQYSLYVDVFMQYVIGNNRYLTWTREYVNNMLAMMQFDDNGGPLDTMFDSDIYPTSDDLSEVLVDFGSYEYRVISKD